MMPYGPQWLEIRNGRCGSLRKLVGYRNQRMEMCSTGLYQVGQECRCAGQASTSFGSAARLEGLLRRRGEHAEQLWKTELQHIFVMAIVSL